MFSIGFVELMMVAVVGLLVLGPERLPGAVRETTLWINKFKAYASDIRRDFDEQVEDIENDSVFAKMREGRQLLDDVQRDVKQSISASTTPVKAEAEKGGQS